VLSCHIYESIRYFDGYDCAYRIVRNNITYFNNMVIFILPPYKVKRFSLEKQGFSTIYLY
jgi:hypothetical protein